jgi:type IV pilus assembly protein PilA
MKNAKGFSLIELLIVVAIILVIAAIAIPNLLRSRMAANEAAAVATLRNINNSQGAYIAIFGGNIGYADTLIKLGPGVPCDMTHACLVDGVLACASQPCLKTGFGYFMASDFATAPIGDYTTTATPASFAGTGQNNFCSTEDGVIRQQIGPTASLGAVVAHDACADATQYTPVSK